MEILSFHGKVLYSDSARTLEKVNLTNCHLRRANLSHKRMRGAIFAFADLDGSDLSAADLSGANFENANLTMCDFFEANLSNCKFNGARMTKVNLLNSLLYGADLSKAIIDRVRWMGARYDRHTRFPPDFSPEKHGLLFAKRGLWYW